MFLQEYEEELKPVVYCSRTLTDSETHYAHHIEKESLAAVWAFERFPKYLYGLPSFQLLNCKLQGHRYLVVIDYLEIAHMTDLTSSTAINSLPDLHCLAQFGMAGCLEWFFQELIRRWQLQLHPLRSVPKPSSIYALRMSEHA